MTGSSDPWTRVETFVQRFESARNKCWLAQGCVCGPSQSLLQPAGSRLLTAASGLLHMAFDLLAMMNHEALTLNDREN
jgi:hypothetical protein